MGNYMLYTYLLVLRCMDGSIWTESETRKATLTLKIKSLLKYSVLSCTCTIIIMYTGQLYVLLVLRCTDGRVEMEASGRKRLRRRK